MIMNKQNRLHNSRYNKQKFYNNNKQNYYKIILPIILNNLLIKGNKKSKLQIVINY